MIQENITAITIVFAAVIAVSVVLIIYLILRVRRVEAEYDLLSRDSEGKTFVEIVNDNIAQVQDLLEEVDELSDRYAWVLKRMAGTVQHIGVVRFDAFRDLGGLLSFAVAMLDDRGNGLVLSSIYGRSESRTYTKPVIERESKYELSPEEKEAIHLAMQSKEKGALPVVARDREHEERMANLRLFHDKEFLEVSQGEAAAKRPRQQDTSRHGPGSRLPGMEPEFKEREPSASGAGEARTRSATRQSDERRSRGRVSHIRPVERAGEATPGKREPVRAEEKRSRAVETRKEKAPPEKRARRAKPEIPEEKPRVVTKKEKRHGEHPERRRKEDQAGTAESPGSRGSEREGREERKKSPPPASQGRRPRHPAEAKKRASRKQSASPQAPGLDTPLERLRDRESRGEQ